MQDWRAIAKFGPGKEALVVLGGSQFQVVQSYQEAFLEVIHTDLQAACDGIVLQRWKPKSDKPNCDKGRWADVGTLRLPGC